MIVGLKCNNQRNGYSWLRLGRALLSLCATYRKHIASIAQRFIQLSAHASLLRASTQDQCILFTVLVWEQFIVDIIENGL